MARCEKAAVGGVQAGRRRQAGGAGRQRQCARGTVQAGRRVSTGGGSSGEIPPCGEYTANVRKVIAEFHTPERRYTSWRHGKVERR